MQTRPPSSTPVIPSTSSEPPRATAPEVRRPPALPRSQLPQWPPSTATPRGTVRGVTQVLTEQRAQEGNPLLRPFDGPFGVPPFQEIRIDHFAPAFDSAMAQHATQIERIAQCQDPPTFANTIEALEGSGEVLTRVSKVFFHLVAAASNDALRALEKEVAPRLSAHYDDITLNTALFRRVAQVWQQRQRLGLTVEQARLLEKTYEGFVRSGAQLQGAQAQRLRELNERSSVLTAQFTENVLKDTKAFALVVDDPRDLVGLAPSLVDAAAEEAQARGMSGRWVFTLDEPMRVPFLKTCENRALRRELYLGYVERCTKGNTDNHPIIAEIAALRYERATLLGYATHAHYVLEENMAKTPEGVYGLLDQLWPKAKARAHEEAAKLQERIAKDGHSFALEPWDWPFYAEKVAHEEYAFDAKALEPYLTLDTMRAAAFHVVQRLYGLTFQPRADVPRWNEHVQAYEVRGAQGEVVGLLMLDHHTSDGKVPGAWMDALVNQRMEGGQRVPPVIFNVCNFPKPRADGPVTLSFEDVQTLFHELGHGLHGLLSQCAYRSLSGTAVAGDFVELPSQILEQWAAEPEVLRQFARHKDTGQPIPEALLEQMKAAARWNQGFAMTEYLAASLLDMRWHTLTASEPVDAQAFEAEVMRDIGMPPQIGVRYRSPYFAHIFGGGYAANYYGYAWAEVLDADAFALFRERGIFDARTAEAFRRILEQGGSVDEMAQYVAFRGRPPTIDALLARKGFTSG